MELLLLMVACVVISVKLAVKEEGVKLTEFKKKWYMGMEKGEKKKEEKKVVSRLL
jgi:hypothetical protein